MLIQRLGVVDATSVEIAMVRHAERPLEGPAEMIRAQPNAVREGGKRYLLGDVFFDIGGHDPLLPGGETAARRRVASAPTGASAPGLNRHHHTAGLPAKPILPPAPRQVA